MSRIADWIFGRWLWLILTLHPRGFRDGFGEAIVGHVECLEGRQRWRLLLDLSRNLPGVHLDRLRMDRPGGTRAPSPLARPEAPMIDLLFQDLRFAARRLLRSPFVTSTAALTLALGIGATTAIFSLINGVYLQPLSSPHSHRLAEIYELNPEGHRLPLSYEGFLDYRRSESFESVAVARAQSVNVTGGGATPERIRGMFISSSFFDVLGEPPVLGRGLLPGEDVPGGEYAAVISHGFWQRRFGGDRGVIGQTVHLNNIEHSIVGVMAPDFRFPYDRTEAWISLQTYPGELNRQNRTLFAMALLKDQISFEQANGEMSTLAGALAESYPAHHLNISAGALPLLETFTPESTRALLQILLAAVATVLMIGAANVANLQLAQATGRLREMAVRAAVGAGRLRLVTQLLVESLLLALIGGLLGVGVAYGGVWLLAEHGPGWIQGRYSIDPDLRVLGFSLAVSIVTGLIFGLLPARRGASGALVAGLKDGQRAGAGGDAGRLRSALVVAQSALAVMLLIGAGLLMRSFSNLQRVDVGFNTDNLMTVQFRLPANKYDSDESVLGFFDQLTQKVEALPGVESAATALGMPFTGDEPRMQVLADGVEPGAEVSVPALRTNIVSLGYFETLDIPIYAGRTFEASDRADGAPVVLLSQAAAARLWPQDEGALNEADIVGRTVGLRGDETAYTVIGVAGDIYNRGLRGGVDPMIYLVQAQATQRFATLAARISTGKAQDYGPILRQAIWDVDPEQPVWELLTQEQRIAGWIGSERFMASLLTIFAGTALLLAAIGIGGVIAYAVALRRRELGIRLSLGASPRRILRLVVGQGLRLVGLGLLVGLVGAVLLRQALDSFLFGVEALDPVSFLAAPLVLLAIAVMAVLAPAWRAAGLDPVRTLREP